MPGEILPIKNKYYELGEAVRRATEQNIRRDYRLSLIATDNLEDLPEEQARKYRMEANKVITEFGANFVPNYPETEHIHAVKLVYLPIGEATEMAAKQMVRHDQHLGILAIGDINDLRPDEQIKYITNARAILKQHGHMWPPSEDFAEHYFVKN